MTTITTNSPVANLYPLDISAAKYLYAKTNVNVTVYIMEDAVDFTTIDSNLRSLNTDSQSFENVRSREFKELLIAWHEERRFSSSYSKIVSCPAYKKIIEMGEPVLPLIFTQIESEGDNPDHWSVALQSITGDNPVPAEARGDTVKMAAAWLEWAKERYVW